MEKLGDDDWSSNLVSSKFEVKHKNGRPIGCKTSTDMIFTEPCGLGWRFAMRNNSWESQMNIYFDSHTSNAELGWLKVCVKLGMNTIIKTKEVSVSLSISLHHIVSWNASDIVASPILTFTVTSDNVNLESLKPQSHKLVRTIQALEESMRTGTFIDTKFYVASRRVSSTNIGCPLALFANSSILRSRLTYFESQFSSTNIDPDFMDLQADFVWGSSTYTEHYDYAEDSDLEDDIGDVGESTGEPTGKRGTVNRCSGTSTPMLSTHPGRTILVKGVAFTTWQALNSYLHTGEIEFSPLKSQLGTPPNAVVHGHRYPSPCSPKSMYRLAHKIGSERLKNLALIAIRSRLSEVNILDEALSRFTSRYASIQKMEVELLFEHYHSAEVMGAFPDKMKSVANGELPHCSPVLADLFSKLTPKE